MKILIAEDDSASRLILQISLSPLGETHTVVNGKEAVEAFKMALFTGRPFDLICLDVMMPEMDGREALRQIRQVEKEFGLEGSAETRIIMTTALDDPKTVVDSFYRGGATSYLVKPIRKNSLLEELAKIGLRGKGEGIRFERDPGHEEGFDHR